MSRKKPTKSQAKVGKSLSDKLEQSESLEQVLAIIGIEEWDFVLVGDGSGSNWSRECGWGSVLIERSSFRRKAFYGGMSHGTVNISEMMAYLHPLMWIASSKPKKGGTRVHVITDSQIVANCGNNKQGRKSNQELWTMFDAFKRKGIFLQCHWIPRDTVALNKFADDIARRSRKAMPDIQQETLEAMKKKLERDVLTVYGLNPCEE